MTGEDQDHPKSFGSRLSSIFTSFDLPQSHGQQHHSQLREKSSPKDRYTPRGSSELPSRTGVGLVPSNQSPLSRAPLSNVSSQKSSHLSGAHGSNQDQAWSQGSVDGIRDNTLPAGSSIKSPKKPRRKPPPPDAMLNDQAQNKHELPDSPLNQSLASTTLKSSGGPSTGLDTLIVNLEDELNHLMQSSNHSSGHKEIQSFGDSTEGRVNQYPTSETSNSESPVGQMVNNYRSTEGSRSRFESCELLDLHNERGLPRNHDDPIFPEPKFRIGDEQNSSSTRYSHTDSKDAFYFGQKSSSRYSLSSSSKDESERHISSPASLSDNSPRMKSSSSAPSVGQAHPFLSYQTSGSSLYSNAISSTQSQISITIHSRSEDKTAKDCARSSSTFQNSQHRHSHVSPASSSLMLSSPIAAQAFQESSPIGADKDRSEPKITSPVSEVNHSPKRSGYPHQPRTPLKNTPTFTSITESTISKASPSSTSNTTIHRKSSSMSSIFSTNSNRHITLATLKKSINLRPGEGERCNYVQTIRRNAGTAYNDLGPETWKLPVGILPVDKRQLLPSNAAYHRMRLNKKTQSSGVGLKHGHLAPRLLAAEVDESVDGSNKFGSLGRSSTFQRESKDASSISSYKSPSTTLSRASSLRQNGNQPSRTASFAGSIASSSSPSIIGSNSRKETSNQSSYQQSLSRQMSTASRVSVGSIRESRFSDGYYQHPGYNFDEESASENYSLSTEGTVQRAFDDVDEEDSNKPRLVLANPDSEESDED